MYLLQFLRGCACRLNACHKTAEQQTLARRLKRRRYLYHRARVGNHVTLEHQLAIKILYERMPLVPRAHAVAICSLRNVRILRAERLGNGTIDQWNPELERARERLLD